MTPPSLPRRNVNARRSGGRNGNGRPSEPKAGFWRVVPPAPDPGEISPAAEPSALVRSLGRPPLDHPGAEAYLVAVVERAAGLATALAAAGGILVSTPDDD